MGRENHAGGAAAFLHEQDQRIERTLSLSREDSPEQEDSSVLAPWREQARWPDVLPPPAGLRRLLVEREESPGSDHHYKTRPKGIQALEASACPSRLRIWGFESLDSGRLPASLRCRCRIE